MLLSQHINALSEDLKDEAQARPYIRSLLGHLADDASFWGLLLEMLEIVLHLRGYVIVPREVADPSYRRP